MDASPERPQSRPAFQHSAAPRFGKRHLVLAALCSLAFLTYLDRIAISRVQEDVQRDLRLGTLSTEQEAELARAGDTGDAERNAERRAALSRETATTRMAWIFTAFLIGYVLFEIPGGRLGDLFGPRRVITRIVIWWSIFTFLTGSVLSIGGLFSRDPSPELLLGIMIAVRFLFGLGEAGAFPNIARALGRWFPYHERARAQGLIWMSSRLGGALGPLVLGVLIQWTGGWEAAFWCLGGVGCVWALWFCRWYRDRPEDMPGTSDAERAWIRGEGHVGETASEGKTPSESEGADTIYDDRPDATMPWLRLIIWPNVLAMYVASAGVSFSFYFFLTFLPRYLEDVHGVAAADSELMCGLPLFAGGIACLVGGRLSDAIAAALGSRRWARALPGLIGFSCAGIAMLATTSATGPWTAVALLTAAFFFQDIGVPCIWSLPADIGGRHAGVLAGAMNSIGAVGGALSPLVAAWIRQDGESGWDAVLILSGAVYIVAGLAWLAIDASKRLESGR
jgi:ACS family glucarate transporter-like MFS transporter